jgi:RNA polymerase primary sigma factor
VRALSGVLLEVFSLDRPVSLEDGALGLREFVEDEQVSEIPETVIRDMENTRLKESMGEMSARERHVLVRRYGLDDRAPATLAELSNERVLHPRVHQRVRRPDARA